MSMSQAEIAAYPYAEAMRASYPNKTITGVSVWQARRDDIHFVPQATALARRNQADAVLGRL